MGEPMYLFLQHCDVQVTSAAGGSTALPPPPAAPTACQHNFQRDRDDLDAIKADAVASEHDYAEIMDRVERWNRVHNRPAVPPRRDAGGAAPVGAPYTALPPGYDGRSTGSGGSGGRTNMPPPYPSGSGAPVPYPSAGGGGAMPSPYPSQPPPQYTPQYPPAYTPGGSAGGGGPPASGGGAPPPYSAAMSGGWTCSNCTYQVGAHESNTTCPICASPRG